jgi:hypothetical protein
MEFEAMTDVIFKKLKPKLEASEGIAVFAKQHADFEGWLKAELCGIFSQFSPNTCPDKPGVNLCLDDWNILLKTVTPYSPCSGDEKKQTPENVQRAIEDIDRLTQSDAAKKAVMIVAFPIEPDNAFWQTQLGRISARLVNKRVWPFVFKAEAGQGMIHLGTV